MSSEKSAVIFADVNDKIGKIKPMHGINQPPFAGMNFGMFHYLTEAGIPFSRTHDVGGAFGGDVLIDIPNLFRDFSADPENPDAYDFTFTDRFIGALVDAGVEPFFRLGVSIENYCQIKAYRIYPPSDNLKWAKICEGVIRHYTEGWADGFHYNIRYFEIWNEPDNIPDPMMNQMWRGTPEQFFKLYEVASRHLKNRFPHLHIGGYASCGFYELTGKVKTGYGCGEHYIKFFEDFLAYIREHDCPLDFFSWHSYSSVEDTMSWTGYVCEQLEKYGYGDAEQFLNEWNVEHTLRGTIHHAALTAAMMLAAQNSPIDGAMFYDARLGVSVYGGVFNPLTRAPFPAYYSFVAFNELYRRKTQIKVDCGCDGIYAVGACGDDGDGCIVIVNTLDGDVNLRLDLADGAEIGGCKILDENHMLTECPLPDVMKPYDTLCITLKKK